MPARGSDKCRQCSKLSISLALENKARQRTAAGKERHATNAEPITAIAIALIRSRRLKYLGDKESAQKLDGISIPTIAVVIIHFYRQRKDEPLHALGIELWVGQQKKAAIEPVHTLGWTEGQVRSYIRDALAQFSQNYLVHISGIAATVELTPSLCPLVPCPLKVSSSGVE